MLSTTSSKKQILKNLQPNEHTAQTFSDGAELHLEHDIAFLAVYRPKENDPGTDKLVRACISYLIAGSDPEQTDQLLIEIAEKMAARFGTFLILEVESGSDFTITGPAKRLAIEFSAFSQRLAQIPARAANTSWQIHTRSGEPAQSALREAFAHRSGVWVKLTVPPAYVSPRRQLFPIYLRRFREKFSAAVQQFVFDFIRLQTPSGIASFDSLGKRSISKKSIEVDRQLAAIAESFRFLLLVAPTNLSEIETTFFESNFEKVLPYHYRLLPIDPDLLKRELFNLRLEDIDDPALSFLFHEKREEVDQELTMLSERGSRNFFYSSVRRYKGVDPEVRMVAEDILRNVPSDDNKTADTEMIDAKEFATKAEQEFAFFREQCPDFKGRIHIRDDLNVLMVSQGELFIPASQRFNPQQVRSLTQHEVGTHVLTHFNGSRQPLRLFADGLADYDPLQEGLAVIAEYFANALSNDRLRILAGRVIAGECLLQGGDFQETFRCLHHTWSLSEKEAFSITVRMFQGGGFLKDIIYLEGLVKLRTHLIAGGDLEPLLAGKLGLKHIQLVAELTARGILSPPTLLPRYLGEANHQTKLQAIRDGLPIHQFNA